MNTTGPPPFTSTPIVEGCVGCGLAVAVFRDSCKTDFGNFEQDIGKRLRPSIMPMNPLLETIQRLPMIMQQLLADVPRSLFYAVFSARSQLSRLTNATKRKYK
jgi:hypothetical protein